MSKSGFLFSVFVLHGLLAVFYYRMLTAPIIYMFLFGGNTTLPHSAASKYSNMHEHHS